MSKVLYFIRHGTALHNVLFLEHGNIVYKKYRDTPLVPKGINEAKSLDKIWKDIDKIELVIVSPLLRTLQTVDNIFCNKDVPIIALDSLMEYPQGLDICNRRKSITEYKFCYPNVNFSYIKDDIEKKWRHNRYESIEELDIRIKEMLGFINQRPETYIAIVSHSSYIGHFLFNKIGEGVNELKHCHPYIHKL
jgi:broad specificity phosphatase PhoE